MGRTVNEKSRAIPRNVLTDFCKALEYDPRAVLSIEAEPHMIAVTTLPQGITGINGVRTEHAIVDEEA